MRSALDNSLVEETHEVSCQAFGLEQGLLDTREPALLPLVKRLGFCVGDSLTACTFTHRPRPSHPQHLSAQIRRPCPRL